MKRHLLLILSFLFLLYGLSPAQTASSLFWRSDSLQVAEVVSEVGDLSESLGHCGPAVENSHMILRLFFDDSGAVDVYSKSGRGMELGRYMWYPSDEIRETAGAGRDFYHVGNTLGLGGIALWDDGVEVRMKATKGRTARVGNTKKGSYAELVAYGVEYGGGLVDIMIRIDMTAKSRIAKISASELSGKKVSFVTGINFHEGQKVMLGEDAISVWGSHPNLDSALPVGAGMFFSGKTFPKVEKLDNMVRLISEPTSKIVTKVISTSALEAELNNAKRLEAYMIK